MTGMRRGRLLARRRGGSTPAVVVARERRRALAARLGGRRRPASVAAATRLAPRRAAPAPRNKSPRRVQVPGMTDAAARWLFLGELPDGIQPFLGGQPAGAPSALRLAAAARASGRSGGVRRGRVEEGPAVARTRPSRTRPRLSAWRSLRRPPRRRHWPTSRAVPIRRQRSDGLTQVSASRRAAVKAGARSATAARAGPAFHRPCAARPTWDRPEPRREQQSTAPGPVPTSRLSRSPASRPHEEWRIPSLSRRRAHTSPPRRHHPDRRSGRPMPARGPSLLRRPLPHRPPAQRRSRGRGRDHTDRPPAVARTPGEAMAKSAATPRDAATAPAPPARTERKRTRPKRDAVSAEPTSSPRPPLSGAATAPPLSARPPAARPRAGRARRRRSSAGRRASTSRSRGGASRRASESVRRLGAASHGARVDDERGCLQTLPLRDRTAAESRVLRRVCLRARARQNRDRLGRRSLTRGRKTTRSPRPPARCRRPRPSAAAIAPPLPARPPAARPRAGRAPRPTKLGRTSSEHLAQPPTRRQPATAPVPPTPRRSESSRARRAAFRCPRVHRRRDHEPGAPRRRRSLADVKQAPRAATHEAATGERPGPSHARSAASGRGALTRLPLPARPPATGPRASRGPAWTKRCRTSSKPLAQPPTRRQPPRAPARPTPKRSE